MALVWTGEQRPDDVRFWQGRDMRSLPYRKVVAKSGKTPFDHNKSAVI